MRAHAERVYPEECCGVLLGTRGGSRENDERTVVEVRACVNTRAGTRGRYAIAPEELVAVQRAARERRLEIIGFYHSHPDHPAEPSGFDLDHSCWPSDSYIIVAVEKGRASVLNSFVKPDYEHFVQEEIVIEE